MPSSPEHLALINRLTTLNHIPTPRIQAVLQNLDRADFLPTTTLLPTPPTPPTPTTTTTTPTTPPTPIPINPYLQTSQVLGYNSVLSAPHLHTLALESLESHLSPGAKVLDVGSGSGYLSAAMAMLVKGKGGHVTAVEHIPELVLFSKECISKSHAYLLSENHIHFEQEDGRFPVLSRFADFDAIHVGGSVPLVPRAMMDMLKIGGRMCCAVEEVGGGEVGKMESRGQRFWCVEREGDRRWKGWKVGRVDYLPLQGYHEQVGQVVERFHE